MIDAPLRNDKMEKSEAVRSGRMISRPLEILLRLFGIWPGASFNPFFKVLWLFITTSSIVSQYLFLINHIRSVDLSTFLYGMAATCGFSVMYIKLVVFWLNQRRFDDMWRTMSVNWTRSSAAAETGGSNISRHLPNIVVALNAVAIITTTFGTVASGINYDEVSNISRPYVQMMELPFDTNTQSTYLFVIFFQFFYLLLVSIGSGSINALLIVMMLYLGDQILIIRRCLKISPEHDKDMIMLKEIVRKHQRVITFSENVESLFTYMTLGIVILNTLITCGLGFILVTAVGTPDFSKIIARNFMFYSTINLETFIFCFAGEYLSTKSREIGEAAYNSAWYKSRFHSRIVLFLIMRSQNQLTITMGKFTELSLERFASITKASASYVSVLLAMY